MVRWVRKGRKEYRDLSALPVRQERMEQLARRDRKALLARRA